LCKTNIPTDTDAYGLLVLEELKARTGIYLPFVSSEFVVCAVCGMKVKAESLGDHVESEHFEPPQRTWKTHGFNPRHKKVEKLY
jgi:hypothetical protein